MIPNIQIHEQLMFERHLACNAKWSKGVCWQGSLGTNLSLRVASRQPWEDS